MVLLDEYNIANFFEFGAQVQNPDVLSKTERPRELYSIILFIWGKGTFFTYF